MSKLGKVRYMYFVYYNGQLDFVALDKKTAYEMAEDPTDGCTLYFQIERWTHKDGKYQFDKRLR